MKVLLHTCCAPCATYVVKTLREEGYEPVLYFFNPNIHPYGEFLLREEAVKIFAEKEGLEAIYEGYGLRQFLREVVFQEDNRCPICYFIRLKGTANYAKEHGIPIFTTTLLLSPYQNQELIRKIGEELEKETGVKFLYRDFRPGYYESIRLSKELGLYRQKYCGCIYSEEEALKQRMERKKGR
ncbi:epoxyqueuosine reductase QueH [bacterium]|nr:epoxyqueuosine reductase QueH [bacterium]